MLSRMGRAAAVNAGAKQSALRQLTNLQSYPMVRARVVSGELALTAWMFLHESGVLLKYDHGQEAFRPPRSRSR